MASLLLNMEKKPLKALGYFWYKGESQRPYYGAYTLKKGKNKGRVRILFRYSATIMREMIVDKTDLIPFTEKT